MTVETQRPSLRERAARALEERREAEAAREAAEVARLRQARLDQLVEALACVAGIQDVDLERVEWLECGVPYYEVDGLYLRGERHLADRDGFYLRVSLRNEEVWWWSAQCNSLADIGEALAAFES